MMDLESLAEVAKNVAAVAGCVVALVTVYRMPLVNGILRRLGRYLFAAPASSWAQKQVMAVVSPAIQASAIAQELRQERLATAVAETLAEAHERQAKRHEESTTWLAESQARTGDAIHLLREQLSEDGKRLADIDSRTLQLLPNGGKSIYDRISRVERALGTGPPVPPKD